MQKMQHMQNISKCTVIHTFLGSMQQRCTYFRPKYLPSGGKLCYICDLVQQLKSRRTPNQNLLSTNYNPSKQNWKSDSPHSKPIQRGEHTSFCYYLEELCPMFCHKNRRFQQSIELFIEVGVFETMLCHENKQAAKSHHTDYPTNII